MKGFSKAAAARAGFGLAIFAAAASSGCSGMSKVLFAPRLPECEGFDVPLSVLAGPSRKQLRVRIVGRRLDEDIPFVVESDKEHLVLVAFTPLGTKSFTLERQGSDVDVDNVTGIVQPIPPRNIMADVLAMSLPITCPIATMDAETPSIVDKWQVTDSCSEGRPLRRRIVKPASGGKPEQLEVEIDYTPDAILVHQRHCKYTARYVLQASGPQSAATQKAAAEKAAAQKPAAATPAAAPAATPAAPKPAPVAAPAPANAAKPAPATPAKADAPPAAPAAPKPALQPAPAPAPSAQPPPPPTAPAAN